MWCSEAGWRTPLNSTQSWAGACIYHRAQLAVGIFSVCVTPILYYVVDLFYRKNSRHQRRQNSIQQWIRVLCSLLLAVACWTETAFAIRTYFLDGDVQLAGLISPVIFSLVPVLAIFFQLFESSFTVGGSGVVLFFYCLSIITIFPTFITASRFFKRRDDIHEIDQFQTALNFCLIQFGLLIICSLTQLLPNISSKKKEKNLAWEEDATLFGRITFGWFSRLILTSNQKSVTIEDLPDIPHYLKGAECHEGLHEASKDAKERVFFIEKPRARGAKKKKSEEKKNPDEDKSLLAKEPKVDKKTAEILELPKPNFRCRQKSLLHILVKTYWVPFMLTALFKLSHDLLAFALPQLLKQFIRWVGSDTQERQWGYIYSLGLFIVPLCQTIFLHQYFWIGTGNGLIIKNAITAEIYRKSLNLASRSRAIYTHGEIVNLMSVDTQKFQDVSTYLHMIWSAPLQISLSLYFLYQELGPSLFAGILVMLVLIPINKYVFGIIGAVMRDLMQFKDKRIKALSEMINSMKVVKLYAWEPFFEQWIHQTRLDELACLWRKAIAGIWASIGWSVAPFLVTLAAFTTYCLSDKENNILTPEKAFVSITYFDLIRFPMQMLPMIYIQMVELMVSVRRLQNFINLPEQEDQEENDEKDEKMEKGTIEVKEGNFKWEKSAEENTLSEINIKITPGELVAVVGHIGSGKSSLVSACLNEMEKVTGSVKIAGSVGYVPQEAWLQNATLEENITFGSDMDRSYYKKCIDAAALTTDLSLLPSGDQTEIGEKGINLSGGQKQRVSLARAAYNSPDIVLFDDPLSAVDPHVANEIFDKLISDKSVLSKKTRMLVTHATQFLPRCDRVILLSKGKVVDQGTYQAVYDANPTYHPILKSNVEEKSTTSNDTPVSPTQSVDTIKSMDKTVGKLTTKEEMKEGTVEWDVFKSYFTKYGMHFIGLYLLLNTIRSSLYIGENLWLADWSNDAKIIKQINENGSNMTDVEVTSVGFRLGFYAFFGLCQACFVISNTLISAKGGIRASRKLHEDLIRALVRFPISYYDKTPSGRILNRCGKDIETVDTSLVRAIDMWMFSGYRVIFGLLAVCIASPYYIFAMPPFFALYFYVQRIFVKTTRQLKRIESVSKSPIYAHFGESINGATTIRAYGHKRRFIDENIRLIDVNSQANYYGSVIAYRWLAVRLECLSHVLVFIAAMIFVMNRDKVNAGMVGFALSTVIRMSQTLNWFVRQTSELETHIVSVERLTEYSDNRDDFPFEAQSDTKVADNWLQKGKIELKNFSLHYKKDNPAALDKLNLTIEAGERVGVCGRTGSGKSSLLVSLFRLFEPDQDSSYEIDGVDCTELPLDALRSKLTIIPQDPILFSNTLRRNLDPFNQFDDEKIFEALRLAHLSTFVSEELDSGLDHKIAEGGANLSAGQRQLICLARALLRQTKILVLDEATASVDSETDQLVQGTIRAEFKNVTILAVAHRIETIDDYDKILVLDQGKIAEFDTPESLKSKENGIYRSMYDAAVGAKKDN